MLYVFAKDYNQYHDWASMHSLNMLSLYVGYASQSLGCRLSGMNTVHLPDWEMNPNYHAIDFNNAMHDCYEGWHKVSPLIAVRNPQICVDQLYHKLDELIEKIEAKGSVDLYAPEVKNPLAETH